MNERKLLHVCYEEFMKTWAPELQFSPMKIEAMLRDAAERDEDITFVLQDAEVTVEGKSLRAHYFGGGDSDEHEAEGGFSHVEKTKETLAEKAEDYYGRPFPGASDSAPKPSAEAGPEFYSREARSFRKRGRPPLKDAADGKDKG